MENETVIALNEKQELEAAGYKVDVVNSGEKAVQFMEKKNNIDLILMDIDLGRGIDGTEAAELILKKQEIPIVFISSHNNQEVLQKTEKVLSYGYVLKDSGPVILAATIKTALKLFNAHQKNKNVGKNISVFSEEDIRTTQAKLTNAMKIAHLGGWELDVLKNEFTFNDEFYAIFHTTAAEQGGYTMSPRQYAERFLYPDDQYLVVKETKEALETDDPNYSTQLEHRIYYADGGIGYISVRIFIVKDDEGRTVKTYGVNQDITEMKKRESEIESLLKEKELLLHEIHHRVKNNMHTIESLLSLQLSKLPEGDAREILKEARHRISIMMNIYRNLSGQDNYQYVDGRKIILETIKSISLSYSLDKKIRMVTEIENCMITVSFAINICIIINELVTNAYKYAFPNNKRGEIFVGLKNLDEDNLVVLVSDNGTGFPPAKIENGDFGLGLTLVKSMIENHDDSMEIVRHEGTSIKIKMKKI
ncbi:MAG: response regulator [Spirochaetales bacterium]|nr:response regulator [Spirochaetales bacterium]